MNEPKPKLDSTGIIITVVVIVIIGVFVYRALTSKQNIPDYKRTYYSSPTEPDSSSEQNTSPDTLNIGQVGKPFKTDYFEVTVNRWKVTPGYSSDYGEDILPAEHGIKYLVIEMTYKNIDNESRMIPFGEVWVNYNGKNYNFDTPEQIFRKGYEIGLEQINPLTSKNMYVAYKMPIEITGPAFYHPGRAQPNEVIKLGDLVDNSKKIHKR